MSEQQSERATRLRVLIADDVQETRRNTRLMLALEPGVEVVAIARDGREAVAQVKEHRPDLALMDVNMPHMDGLSAIRAMLQVRPEMGCIVMSAERDRQTLRQAMAAGARDYLIKPFTTDELLEAVKRVGRVALANRRRAERAENLRRQRDEYLARLAQEYAQARRSDDEALKVFEELAVNPTCELRWLMTLAMIYVIRREWSKLKVLAGRLEKSQ